MAQDLKYGRVSTERGDLPDDEPVVVFCGHDIVLPDLLDAYQALCAEAGSPQFHLDLIDKRNDEIVAWQRENPDRVRPPASASYQAAVQAGEIR